MPRRCCISTCSGMKKNRRTYSIPSDKNIQGQSCEKKLERRNLWLNAIFGNISEVPENLVVCEIHFVTGKPVHEEGHEDWVPSLHMPVHVQTAKEENADESAENLSLLPTTSTQSDNLLDRLLMKDEEMERNPNVFEYYTGLPYKLGKLILGLILPVYEQSNHPCSLAPFQEFMLAMMKLRLNLQFTDLGFRFNVDRRTASRIFYKWLDLLYYRLRSFVRWPTREEIRCNVPTAFLNAFGDKISVILDCFSIYTETSQNHKHQNCIKYLIGITPQGHICFISKAYVGNVSDTFITEDCGILDNLQIGDYVLANRGFLTAELVQPADARGKVQMEPREIKDTKSIANVRILVERVIGVLRMRYKILSQVLPHHVLNQSSNDGLTSIDKILTICCALVNNSEESIV